MGSRRWMCFNGAVDERRRRVTEVVRGKLLPGELQWSRRRTSTERHLQMFDGGGQSYASMEPATNVDGAAQESGGPTLPVWMLQWSRRRTSTERKHEVHVRRGH